MEQNKQKPYVIGMDLGGTNAVFGIVDRDANIIAQTSVKTQDYPTVEEFVDACIETLKPIISEAGGIDKIYGMGGGAPNANYYLGTIEQAPNLVWAKGKVVPLAKMFSDRLGVNVALTNDANAAALGEMTYGCAKGMKDFIVLTLGTGVGSGIVCNGQLLFGHDGFAGELGHVNIVKGGRTCGCGNKGCLEAYCSATGLIRTTKEWLKESDEPTMLRDIPQADINPWEVEKCARKGDAVSQRIYDYTGRLLGEACANMAVFSSPEAFIFFGGMSKAKELILKPVEEAYNACVMPFFRRKPKFMLSSLDGAGAAVLGAAALGWTVKGK